MTGMTSYRPRNPKSDDPEERYRGFETLPKTLLPRNAAQRLEAEQDAADERQRCQEALDFAARSSGAGGLPFDDNSRMALQALGTGKPEALSITDVGMKLADDFFQRNKNLLEEQVAVSDGIVGKLNFGAGAMSEGYGQTINGPRPDPLGALLGRASVMVDRDGKLVGISDEFDYNNNPENDWMTRTAMRIVNDRITRDCRDRVQYVPISGGRAIPKNGGEK